MLLEAKEFDGDKLLLADDDIIFVLILFINASLNGVLCCSVNFS